jgi:hypothetical protein
MKTYTYRYSWLEAKIKESGGDQPCTPLKKLKSGVPDSFIFASSQL